MYSFVRRALGFSFQLLINTIFKLAERNTGATFITHDECLLETALRSVSLCRGSDVDDLTTESTLTCHSEV